MLIGGAPGTGKSYLARRIGEEVKLPWISTDSVREMMRELVRKEDYPELFHFSNDVGAEKYLSTHTPEQIVDSQNRESIGVWKGIEAIISTDYVWKDFIIEGIAVLPELVSSLSEEKVAAMTVFLVDDNKERIRNMVYKRGVWDDAGKYPDEVKEVEVEWVGLFNSWLRKEAEKYGFDIQEVDNIEETQTEVIQKVRRWLTVK